jgi:hypothetical protein
MDSLYIIIIILIFVLFLCILAIFLMNIFNNNLKNMKIVLSPKFNTSKPINTDVQGYNNEEDKNYLRHTLYKDMVEGFESNNKSKNIRPDQYGRDMRFEDVSKYYFEKNNMDFTEKSEQRHNYPNLDEMTSLEKQNFLFNYPKNMTIKDYENWLRLQIQYERRDKIPDVHHKYYDKVKNGKRLKYIYKKCPPEDNMPLFMAGNEVFDFYKNIYDAEKIKVNNKVSVSKNDIDGYNITVYPSAK